MPIAAEHSNLVMYTRKTRERADIIESENILFEFYIFLAYFSSRF